MIWFNAFVGQKNINKKKKKKRGRNSVFKGSKQVRGRDNTWLARDHYNNDKTYSVLEQFCPYIIGFELSGQV